MYGTETDEYQCTVLVVAGVPCVPSTLVLNDADDAPPAAAKTAATLPPSFPLSEFRSITQGDLSIWRRCKQTIPGPGTNADPSERV